MISRSENIIDFCVGTVQEPRNRVPSSWASTTSILHQRQAHRRETMRFSINKGRAWGMNTMFRLKGKRDENSI
jgi:hypothetical protein